MIKRRIFTLVALSLLCAFAVAGADTLPPAKEIFDQAKEKRENLTFSAVSTYEKDTIKVSNKIFQRKNEDGTVFKHNSGDERFSITNADGSFTIFPEIKKAVRNDATAAALDPGIRHYEIKQGSFQGRECYIVTERVEDTPELRAEFDKLMAELGGDAMPAEMKKNAYRQNLAMLMVYYIGVDDLFIYSQENFSLDGNQVGRITYSDVDFFPQLADSLFEVPADYTIDAAKDSIENFKKESALSKEASDNRHRFDVRPTDSPKVLDRLWSVRGLFAAILVCSVILIGVLAAYSIAEKRKAKK